MTQFTRQTYLVGGKEAAFLSPAPDSGCDLQVPLHGAKSPNSSGFWSSGRWPPWTSSLVWDSVYRWGCCSRQSLPLQKLQNRIKEEEVLLWNSVDISLISLHTQNTAKVKQTDWNEIKDLFLLISNYLMVWFLLRRPIVIARFLFGKVGHWTIIHLQKRL